jgi:hypothetical protein
MLERLISKHEEDNDSDYHNTTLTETPIQTADDSEYTPEEIGMVIEAIISKKKHLEKAGSLVTYFSVLINNS